MTTWVPRGACEFSRQASLFGRAKSTGSLWRRFIRCSAGVEADNLTEETSPNTSCPETDHSATSLSMRLPVFREQDLVACVEAYLSQGEVHRAIAMFNYYLNSGHEFSHDNVLHNQLLMGWAKKRMSKQTANLLRRFVRKGFVPDAQTYATLLFLHSTQMNKDKAKEVLKDMEEAGVSINDLFFRTALSDGQVSRIRKILKVCLGHDFEESLRPPTPPALEYPPVIREWYENRTSGHARSNKVLFTDAELKKRLKRQLNIEKEGGLAIETIAQSLETRCKNDVTGLKAKWKFMLSKPLEMMINENSTLAAPTRGEGKRNHYTRRFYPFLTLLDSKEWKSILVDEIAMLVVTQANGLPASVLCRRLCDSMWTKKTMKQLYSSGVPSKVSSMYKQYTDFLSNSDSTTRPSREFWEELNHKNVMMGTMKPNPSRVPPPVMLQLGAALLDVLIKSVTFKEEHPGSKPVRAFYHVYEFVGERKIGYVKAHPQILNLLRGGVYKIKVETAKVPMLVPPRPWLSVQDGAYLLTPSALVRTYPSSHHHRLLTEPSLNLAPVCDAVNYVSQCPWRVNTKILNLIIDLFRGNGNEDLSIPVSDFPKIPDIPKGASTEERRQGLKERKKVHKLTRELYSLRMEMLYRLSLAKYFENEVFWLPHNLDFRGRAYPIPPHLSHMSSDPARGILMFGEGRPLGRDGLKWLKIHLVNLHGVKKKASLAERAAYADEIMDSVLDSADNPMDGKKWWQGADSPWQALAVCMEIAAAVRSGDPSSFVSHLPVHQDGSCNGLQHYAALGRDVAGAKQVNLIPSDKPEDLYHAVAMMVEKKRQADAENGVDIALELEGKIHRKVVKQTVMTVVYGVTVYGGRRQVEGQLEDVIPDELLKTASRYIVRLIFETLGDMFFSARLLQDWLTDSARQISMVGHLTEWSTPLGLPVVQSYTKRQKLKVKTPLQVLTTFQHDTQEPSKMKQKNGFPPNFIHSLDSTHMMLTALHCQRAGVAFVSVHDSFWTHACSVDTMNRICREQFVALHQQPIIEDLARSFEEKFGGMKYRCSGSKEDKACSFDALIPTEGDLDIENVLQSKYFFS